MHVRQVHYVLSPKIPFEWMGRKSAICNRYTKWVVEKSVIAHFFG